MKTDEENIEQLLRRFRLLEDRYNKLWAQHKLLRLSYRSLKTATKNSPHSGQGLELNEAFQDLLYGWRIEEAHLIFTDRKKLFKKSKR